MARRVPYGDLTYIESRYRIPYASLVQEEQEDEQEEVEYILPEYYGPLYEWEHITTIKRGQALNNPFTGGGPGVVNTTIESMT
eukprot:3592862-Pleurochrysis_carterae.AAC.1